MASMVRPGRQQARGEAASPARCCRRPRKTYAVFSTTSASEMLRKYDMKGFYMIWKLWKDSKWILNGLRQFEAVKIMRIYKIGENVFQVIDVMVRETGSRWLHAAVAAVSTLSACWTCVDKPSTAALAVKSIQPDCTTKHEAVFYHCHFPSSHLLHFSVLQSA